MPVPSKSESNTATPWSTGGNERCKVLCGLPRPLHRLLLIPDVVPGSGDQSAHVVLNRRHPCPPWSAPGLPTAPGPRAIRDTLRPPPTRPGAGSASCVRLSRKASLPCALLVAASYITWGIMRERSKWKACSSRFRPRIIHVIQNAALVVTGGVVGFRRWRFAVWIEDCLYL